MVKSKHTKNIMVYADYGCTTGYGNVAKELVKRLSQQYPMHMIYVFALNNYAKEAYEEYDNVMVHPAVRYRSTEDTKPDLYCRLAMLQFLNKRDFDLFFMMNDVELAHTIIHYLKNSLDSKRKQRKKIFKSIFYFPIDSPPRKAQVQQLDFFDELITYTPYGKSVIQALVTEKVSNRVNIINHGVDFDIFHALPQKKRLQLRKDLFPGADFVIGTVNRNSPRKDIASLVIAFSKFVESVNDINAVLYLHMNPKDASGINLYNLCERLDLKVGIQVILLPDFSENSGIDPSDLNMLYNSFDIFVTTTTAEGWGLTVTEAMAAEIPVMCPMHTSLTYIADDGNRAIPIRNLQESVFLTEAEKIRYRSNPNQVAFQLESFYNTKKFKPEVFEEEIPPMVQRASDFVKTLPWHKVFGEFKIIFDKYL